MLLDAPIWWWPWEPTGTWRKALSRWGLGRKVWGYSSSWLVIFLFVCLQTPVWTQVPHH
jgi:hypothetical protein